MILPRYVPAIAAVGRDLALSRLIRRRLRLHPDRALVYALSAAGLGQADLVLALLEIDTVGARRAIALVVGRPIRVLPSAFLMWRRFGKPKVEFSPKIVRVTDACPRRPGTDAERRFVYCFRPGLTLEQARARGATRRDVSRAVRKGWVVLGEGRAA